MSVGTLESGDGLGYTAKVEEGGNLLVRTTEPVEVSPSQSSSVTRTATTVPITSTTLLASNTARKQLQVQNLSGANAVHVRFDSANASNDDVRIDPGGIYSFPNGVSYTGEITAIAIGAPAKVVALEFK